MYNLLTLIGIVFAIAGTGSLLVLLIMLKNNQLPFHSFGALVSIMPFILLTIAAVLLTRKRI